MKKRISLLLAVLVLLSVIGLPTLASAEHVQPELNARVKKMIEVDGYQFKDLNGNGALDVYEDWRADIEDRITDLYSQMTLKEKAAMFIHPNTCGNPAGVSFADSRYLW